MISSFQNYLALLERDRVQRVIQQWDHRGAASNSVALTREKPTGVTIPVPGAAAVPLRNEPWAIGQANGIGTLRLAHVRTRRGSVYNSDSGFGHLLIDMLGHQSGLSAAVTGEQTVNLPTAPLTRYTDGVGVMMGYWFFATPGATGVEGTVRYTNELGVGNRVTPSTLFSGVGLGVKDAGTILPLQAGDHGVRSVEGVTLAASTGAAGNLGLCLFKPLLTFPGPVPGDEMALDIVIQGFAPRIYDDACLTLLTHSFASAAALDASLMFDFTEDDA